MNRTRLLTIAVIGLLLLNFGTLTYMFLNKSHDETGPPHSGKEEGPKYIIMARLHFNQTQKLQYSAMVDEHRRATRELHEESRAIHDKLFLLLRDRTTDEEKKMHLIEQIAENQERIEKLNFEHFQEIKSLCKGVQLKYFDELVYNLGKLFAPKRPGK